MNSQRWSGEANAAKQARRIEFVKSALTAMAAGDSAYEPSYFEAVMTDFMLTPKDIDATAEQIESAKATWAEKHVR